MKALVWAGIVQGVRRSRLGVKLTRTALTVSAFYPRTLSEETQTNPNNIASTCKVLGKV